MVAPVHHRSFDRILQDEATLLHELLEHARDGCEWRGVMLHSEACPEWEHFVVRMREIDQRYELWQERAFRLLREA